MTTANRPQLSRLVQPIPEQYVKRDPGSGEPYVPHGVIKQFLLYILGPYDLEQVAIHRGDVLSRVKRDDAPPFTDEHSAVLLHNVIVGATYRLTCEIDGRRTMVEQTGDVDKATNWPHDGARLKDAESDAIKRCTPLLGLGLHLWAGELYVLGGWLRVSKDGTAETSGAGRGGSAPDTTSEPAEPASGGTATAGSDPPAEPKRQRISRARTSKTKQENASAEPAAPQAPPAEDAPAATAQAPPGVAAGATSPNGHPADQAQTMEQVAAALGRSLNNCWIRLRRAAQQGELPAKPFGELATADQLKQLGGDDLKLARAWLIDHNRGAAA